VSSNDVRTRGALLLAENPIDAIPIAPLALTRAQATKKELARFSGARIFYQNGDMREILRLQVVGLYGNGFLRKTVSALTSAWQIHVELSAPLSLSVDDKRGLLLKHSHERSTLVLDREHEYKKLRQALFKAISAAELFDALRVPFDEDCLDVL